MIETLALLAVWAGAVIIHSLLSKNIWHVGVMGAVTAALVTISLAAELGAEQACLTGTVLFGAETAFLLYVVWRQRVPQRVEALR